MHLALLFACAAEPAPEPGTTVPATTDTGCAYCYRPVGAEPLRTELAFSDHSPGSATYWQDDSLAVTLTGGDDLSIERVGLNEGCGCNVALYAWLFAEEGILRLHWDAGTCDMVYLCDQGATVFDVPPGTWTIDEFWGSLATSVVVP